MGDLHRLLRKIQNAATARRYFERCDSVTDKWQRAKKDCECGRDHKAIGYKSGDRWYEMCPINYYIILGWKAVTENRAVPSEEMYWELLGKRGPEREIVQEPTVQEYWSQFLSARV